MYRCVCPTYVNEYVCIYVYVCMCISVYTGIFIEY